MNAGFRSDFWNERVSFFCFVLDPEVNTFGPFFRLIEALEVKSSY